jgi:hypothetical protein
MIGGLTRPVALRGSSGDLKTETVARSERVTTIFVGKCPYK